MRIERSCTQYAPTNKGQQHLNSNYQRHYLQKALIQADVLQKVEAISTHIKAIGYSHENVSAEEACVGIDMIIVITEQMVNPRTLVEGNAHNGHIQATDNNARQHFFADNRRTAALRRLAQILRQRRLAAKSERS